MVYRGQILIIRLEMLQPVAVTTTMIVSISRYPRTRRRVSFFGSLPRLQVFPSSITCNLIGDRPHASHRDWVQLAGRILPWDSKVSTHRNNFQFLPFGAGRRICPGLNFGLATVEIMLANLISCFDWELPAGMHKEDIDMTEAF
ncbi:hypothetical protein PR202_ga30969 [Eleusine coracana subsp. coracana]|uniref:Uncharacterized protein n=1 Tax=Eleusine coracana subsp. coracana TaxID=191504 RepID=A0AAV5DRC8_ELECO|nr:hypothetical protein PR202_ga30969 [Eleusine coracana subsp. coracana]